VKHKQGRRTGRRRRRRRREMGRRRTERYNYERISSSKVFPERDFSSSKRETLVLNETGSALDPIPVSLCTREIPRRKIPSTMKIP
jgi:hypothetical protein